LQTYGEGNGRWRVGGGGTVQSVLGDGRVGGGDDRWSSSKQQLGAGGIGSVGRRCELKQQMAARVRGFQLDLAVGFI
jgi:hypothetical protein